MKQIMLFTTLIILINKSQAQGIGINSSGASAHASALLDLTSTSKGLLIPRMQPFERQSIQSPAEGLMVYDNYEKDFYFHNGTQWKTINGSLWSEDADGNVYAEDLYTNVGIGLIEPDYKLTVKASGLGFVQESYDGGNSKLGIYTFQDIAQVRTVTNTSLGFGTNNAHIPTMTVHPSGNVGIGYLAPSSKLHVYGDGRFYGTVYVNHDKGIVRSVNSTQMKMMRVTISLNGTAMAPGVTYTSGYLNFGENFSSVSVMVANCLTADGSGGSWQKILITPFEVDTVNDRCRFKYTNTSNATIDFNASWQVVLVGN